jgi:ppGpp synthetase/RelA/SpoT-type nucleotidyltranferase
MKDIIATYQKNRPRLEAFRQQVVTYFEQHAQETNAIHSIKSRLKTPTHLEDKIERKKLKGEVVTSDNLFEQTTDLIGVRVLHLYQDQYPIIHNLIIQQINELEWKLIEPPKAFSWDPEMSKIYDSLDIVKEVRDTYYTSVHYVVAPNNPNPNPTCCEIQVRTLFEEIWGEIDHTINYPHKTTILACKEQLRVLSKLVSTGTRLADSIFRSYHDLKINS